MKISIKKDALLLYFVIAFVYLFFWIHNDPVKPDGFLRSLTNNFWQVIFVVGMNAIYFDVVLPRLITSRRYRVIRILFSVILHLLTFMIGLYFWRVVGEWISVYYPFRKSVNFAEALYRIAQFTPGAFVLFAVIKLAFEYSRLKYESQQIYLEKKHAELLFIKTQINPHFLFNTLNNIYSLSQYRQDLASDSILRLSKILRYILYEATGQLIPAEKEMAIINDYINLEKLRHNEMLTIVVRHEIDDTSEKIPPLLLLPLVENAFKHGIADLKGKKYVDVSFTIKNRQLHFVVENSADPSAAEKKIQDNIGLANIRRHLSLLYKEFELVTRYQGNYFYALLTINLSSYEQDNLHHH